MTYSSRFGWGLPCVLTIAACLPPPPREAPPPTRDSRPPAGGLATAARKNPVPDDGEAGRRHLQQREQEDAERAKESAVNAEVVVTTAYDEFRDRTDITLQSVEIVWKTRYGAPTLHMLATASYAGHAPVRPTTVLLVFRSHSGRWRFLRSHDLTVLADGVRLGPWTTEHDGDVLGGRSVSETISAEIRIEDLEAMAGAETVRFRIGTIDFTMPPHGITALSKFVAQLPGSNEGAESK